MRSVFLLSLLLATSHPVHAENLDEINVSGARGADGANGVDYGGTKASGSGTDGRDGGDAGPAEPGEHSGKIKVHLSDTGTKDKPVVQIKGQTTEPSLSKSGTARNGPPIQRSHPIGNKGSIVLKAIGGDGGNGGDGGDGQEGADGYSGTDATRYSNGTNGGPGGDGGNGGNATSGKPAGDGGDIHVEVPDIDTHLLMLIESHQQGGKGGARGKNGRGGSGGSGGPGGSSYSWTETHTRTNSKGETESYTTYHSNPGGWSGSDGSDGADGSANVQDGEDGAPGKFKIIVKSAGGSKEYDERYQLFLKSYKIRDSNRDGIYEPNGGVEIYDIVVENISPKNGGMPTPPNHPIQLMVDSQGWIREIGEVLTIKDSIAPQASYALKDEVLKVDLIPWQASKPGDRLQENQTFSPEAKVTRVERRFQEFPNNQTFEVTQPLEFRPIDALESVAAGDGTRVFFEVKNISSKPYGLQSDSARSIGLEVQASGGDLGKNKVRFNQLSHPSETEALKQATLEAKFRHSLPILQPGESMIVSAEIMTDPSSEAYRLLNIDTSLFFADPRDPKSENKIQFRTLPLRIGEVYTKAPNSRVLLVTNHGTEKAEITAWKSMLKRMGMEYDIWDLSLNNGAFDLARDLPDGSNLMNNYKNGLVVVLNNQFAKGNATEQNPEQMRGAQVVDPRQALRALAANGTHIYFVGGDSEFNRELMRDLMLPRSGDDETQFKNPKEFLRYARQNLNRSRNADDRDIDVKVLDEDARHHELSTYVVPVSHFRWWGKPSEGDVNRAAEGLMDRLTAMHPDLRFVIETQPEIPAQETPGKWFHRWNIGDLLVRQTLDASHASAVASSTPDATLHNAKWVRGENNHVGLFLSLTFDQKLELLQSIMDREVAIVDKNIWENTVVDAPRISKEMVDALIDSIFINVAQEQAALRTSRWNMTLSNREIREKMRLLTKLSQMDFPDIVSTDDAEKTNDSGEIAIKVLAKARFLLQSQSRWYDQFLRIFGKSDTRMTNVGMSIYNEMERRALGKIPWFKSKGQERWVERVKQAKEDVRSRVADMYKAVREQNRLEGNQKTYRKDLVLTNYIQPESRGDELVLDTEVGKAQERILTPEHMDQIRASDVERDKHSDAVEDSKREARARLSIANPCKENMKILGTQLQAAKNAEKAKIADASDTSRVRE